MNRLPCPYCGEACLPVCMKIRMSTLFFGQIPRCPRCNNRLEKINGDKSTTFQLLALVAGFMALMASFLLSIVFDLLWPVIAGVIVFTIFCIAIHALDGFFYEFGKASTSLRCACVLTAEPGKTIRRRTVYRLQPTLAHGDAGPFHLLIHTLEKGESPSLLATDSLTLPFDSSLSPADGLAAFRLYAGKTCIASGEIVPNDISL